VYIHNYIVTYIVTYIHTYTCTEDLWVECEACKKWRREDGLRSHIDATATRSHDCDLATRNMKYSTSQVTCTDMGRSCEEPEDPFDEKNEALVCENQTQNQEHQTQNQKHQTQNQEHQTQNQKHQTQNQGHQTQNQGKDAVSLCSNIEKKDSGQKQPQYTEVKNPRMCENLRSDAEDKDTGQTLSNTGQTLSNTGQTLSKYNVSNFSHDAEVKQEEQYTHGVSCCEYEVARMQPRYNNMQTLCIQNTEPKHASEGKGCNCSSATIQPITLWTLSDGQGCSNIAASQHADGCSTPGVSEHIDGSNQACQETLLYKRPCNSGHLNSCSRAGQEIASQDVQACDQACYETILYRSPCNLGYRDTCGQALQESTSQGINGSDDEACKQKILCNIPATCGRGRDNDCNQVCHGIVSSNNVNTVCYSHSHSCDQACHETVLDNSAASVCHSYSPCRDHACHDTTSENCTHCDSCNQACHDTGSDKRLDCNGSNQEACHETDSDKSSRIIISTGQIGHNAKSNENNNHSPNEANHLTNNTATFGTNHSPGNVDFPRFSYHLAGQNSNLDGQHSNPDGQNSNLISQNSNCNNATQISNCPNSYHVAGQISDCSKTLPNGVDERLRSAGVAETHVVSIHAVSKTPPNGDGKAPTKAVSKTPPNGVNECRSVQLLAPGCTSMPALTETDENDIRDVLTCDADEAVSVCMYVCVMCMLCACMYVPARVRYAMYVT
jgi:hypothetical protein